MSAVFPVSREERLESCLNFFRSVIQSGEEWTSICETEYGIAVAPDPKPEPKPDPNRPRQHQGSRMSDAVRKALSELRGWYGDWNGAAAMSPEVRGSWLRLEAALAIAEPTRKMAEGCRSAISPCSHQQRDPYSLCETCRTDHERAYPADQRDREIAALRHEITWLRDVHKHTIDQLAARYDLNPPAPAVIPDPPPKHDATPAFPITRARLAQLLAIEKAAKRAASPIVRAECEHTGGGIAVPLPLPLMRELINAINGAQDMLKDQP